MSLYSSDSYQFGNELPSQYRCSLSEPNYDYTRFSAPMHNYPQNIYPTTNNYDTEMYHEPVRADYGCTMRVPQPYYCTSTENTPIASSYMTHTDHIKPSRGYHQLYRKQAYNISNEMNIAKPTPGVRYKRIKAYGVANANAPHNDSVSSAANQSTPLFLGKDPSYPAELNNLMNPFYCELCNSRLNSMKSANIHYESKVHDRHITSWLKKTYTDKGLEAPVLKRFLTETGTEVVSAYHCELCKLDLSSAQHALQHFNGKRHRHAASKITPISGIGYFNMEGKWVQTGKVYDKITGKETSYVLVNTPCGFEPVILHEVRNQVPSLKRAANIEDQGEDGKDVHEPPDKIVLTEGQTAISTKSSQTECAADTDKHHQTSTVADTKQASTVEPKMIQEKATTANQADYYRTLPLESHKPSQTRQTIMEALDSKECKICNISTTSRDQMLLHLKGSRHSKKLKALGEAPISPIFQNSFNTILDCLDENDSSDMSVYRTPSGSYYCKICNTATGDDSAIKRHIQSKKHLNNIKTYTPT